MGFSLHAQLNVASGCDADAADGESRVLGQVVMSIEAAA